MRTEEHTALSQFARQQAELYMDADLTQRVQSCWTRALPEQNILLFHTRSAPEGQVQSHLRECATTKAAHLLQGQLQCWLEIIPPWEHQCCLQGRKGLLTVLIANGRGVVAAFLLGVLSNTILHLESQIAACYIRDQLGTLHMDNQHGHGSSIFNRLAISPHRLRLIILQHLTNGLLLTKFSLAHSGLDISQCTTSHCQHCATIRVFL
mmetsp:Transcript_103420/g.183339  ORF Transcript_103420/g.183339 Transcript_103420/m.183339 type:complete len:208 (+) Transcript_103420:543-1166(+)